MSSYKYFTLAELLRSDTAKKKNIDNTPSWDVVEHLGELVLFLCSEAGSQVRGAAWNVDDGWLAQ